MVEQNLQRETKKNTLAKLIYQLKENKVRDQVRQIENGRRQRNVASGILKIVEPGNPNTQSLYASDKADEALEEKKKKKSEWVKERTEICRVRGPPKVKFNMKNCKPGKLMQNTGIQ